MSKYVDGYKPKIEYWNYKLTNAVSEGNVSAIKYASDKIAYFVQRQVEVYGEAGIGHS